MNSERAREIYNNLITNGVSSIQSYIANRKAEELFLDFKRSADDGNGKKLHDNDRKNLAKAISGFGNSEGGVIVWGVDCSKDSDGADVAKSEFPIENVDRFVSLLQAAVSGCTTPPHIGVENYAIKKDADSGFIVTLIPKSMNSPHQSIIDSKYYMRSGSSFSPVPHSVLVGMFGKRPQPWVFLMFSVGPAKINMRQDGSKEVLCQIGFMITNNGRGIARDSFLNVEIHGLPGKNCKSWFDWVDKTNWTGSFAFGFKLGIICNENFRIPPRNFAQPIILNVSLVPPFDKGMNIELKCGCEGSPSADFSLSNIKTEIERYYNEICSSVDLSKSQGLIGKLFSIKQGELKEESSLEPSNPANTG